MVHHRTLCIIEEARFGDSVLPLCHLRDARLRGIELRVAFGLLRFAASLVPLCRGHAVVLFPRSRAYQYEYLGQNVEYSINQFYTIDHPQLKMLLALGTLEPMWLILCDFVNERRRT